MSEKQAFVKRREFASVKHLLPEVLRWDGKEVHCDLFICAIGFEPRAMAVCEELARSHSGGNAKAALVGEYQTNRADNELNRGPILDALAKFCGDVNVVPADHPQQIASAIDGFIQTWDDQAARLSVVLDISGASGTFILSALAALFKHAQHVSLDILYAEPERYFPEHEEYETRLEALVESAVSLGDDDSFIEQGVSDVDVNELYPGINVESRPDFIIAIPALRTSRLVKCLGHIGDQPLAAPSESIFWVLGQPPASALQWRLDLQRRIVNRQLASIVGKEPGDETAPRLSSTNSVVCSTRDYRMTLDALIRQIDLKAGSNVWLAHMGAKLQAVGVALALSCRSEVAVVRSRPVRFNASRHSAGIGPMWRINITELNAILRELKTIGQLVLEPKIETSRDASPVV